MFTAHGNTIEINVKRYEEYSFTSRFLSRAGFKFPCENKIIIIFRDKRS